MGRKRSGTEIPSLFFTHLEVLGCSFNHSKLVLEEDQICNKKMNKLKREYKVVKKIARIL